MRRDDGLRSPELTVRPRFGRHPVLVALAIAALMIAAAREASAQFGIGGFGGFIPGIGGGGPARMQGAPLRGSVQRGIGVPVRGQTMPGAAGRLNAGKLGPGNPGPTGRAQNAGAGGIGPQGCRGPRCGGGYPGPRGWGGSGIIVGVPPIIVPPYGGPPPDVGPGQVVDEDGPPPRRRLRDAGTKPPGGGQTAQQPPSSSPRAVSGMPPAGERRFVPDRVVAVLRGDLTDRQVDAFLRQNRLARTTNGSQQIALLGVRLFRFRITDGRPVRSVIAALGRDPRVVTMQPEYLYGLAQTEAAAAAPAADAEPRDPVIERMQYAVGKLKLPQAHRVGRGAQVLVAVIDSRIDSGHPELAGAIVREIDVIEDKDGKPHSHGTAMAGAIVAKARLMGVAPEAQVIAVRAFSVTSQGSAAGTSFDLTRAVDRAVAEGARIVNLSFAGPADPLFARVLRAAREKGVVLIAAAGNAGPRSAPLYPAADANVIAVTATDADDKVYRGANRGKHIAVAAPGVDILVAGPQGAYEMSTGTSVAAAQVSGIAALLMARNPALDPEGVRRILMGSARDLGTPGPDEDYGAGLADAYQALVTVDPKAAEAVPVAGAPTR
jgi:subtilase family protein